VQDADVVQLCRQKKPGVPVSGFPLTHMNGGAQPTDGEQGACSPGSWQDVTTVPTGTRHSYPNATQGLSMVQA
jgi:hypothetical protein